jgi:predicted MFS family arabinose efflux permease
VALGELSPPRHGGAFAVPEFRVLWLAYTQSVLGDQLARVALAILVFARTGSPAWTAATYALTMLPALVSGVLLSGLADRFPRRAVMVCADLTRASLVGVMSLPGVPLPLIAGLLVVTQFAEAPFGAAQGAMLPSILGPRRYEQGQRVLLVTYQTGLLAGFAAGGLVVAWVGARLALTADAATFLASALLIRIGVKARAAAAQPGVRLSIGRQIRDGTRLVLADRRLRSLVGLGWLAGFTVVPEGLAVPFAEEVGAGAAAVGFLLAADPAGTIVGAYLLGRSWIGEQRRLRWLGPLAVATSLPLLFYLAKPALVGAIGLLAISGACSAYQITAGATFVRLTPDHQRGQTLGLARSGLIAVQGIGVAVGGLVAQWSGNVTGTVGLAGAAGLLCAVGAAVAWRRAGPQEVAAALAKSPDR